MSDQLKLFCWVLDISRKPFPVDIGRSQTVGDLAAKIKLEKPNALQKVDADGLTMWKVSDMWCQLQLSHCVNIHKVSILESRIKEELALRHFEDKNALSRGTLKLSNIFTDPHEEHIHIVVRAPGGESYQHAVLSSFIP